MTFWVVPKIWTDERCFIIAGGESVRLYENVIPRLQGRIIAIKQSVALRPDADVMFIAGKDDGRVCAPFFSKFRGEFLVARGEYTGVPKRTLVLQRWTPAERLCHVPTAVAGLDAGTSAINLAYLFGASEIILLGYDMRGGRWFNDRLRHHLPFPPQRHFELHLAQLPTFAKDLEDAGVAVINCSPGSAVTVFPQRALEEFL